MMLTAKQVGERLGIARGRKAFSKAGVTNYIHQGLLKAEKIGNMWVVTEAELERFLHEEFAGKNLVGGRPRLHPRVEKRPGHGNAGKKYRRRQKADAAE